MIDTSASWRCTDQVPKDNKWFSVEFNDSDWKPAKELGLYGCKPWGTFAAATTYGPYSTGIPGKVSITYVPESRPVRFSHLELDAKYRAQAFDPTNGDFIDLESVHPVSNSGGVLKKPAAIQSDDWVVVVQRIE